MEEEGRKYSILSGICRGRGEEVLDTLRDMDSRRGESIRIWILIGICRGKIGY